jgi:hypothetical protein
MRVAISASPRSRMSPNCTTTVSPPIHLGMPPSKAATPDSSRQVIALLISPWMSPTACNKEMTKETNSQIPLQHGQPMRGQMLHAYYIRTYGPQLLLAALHTYFLHPYALPNTAGKRDQHSGEKGVRRLERT